MRNILLLCSLLPALLMGCATPQSVRDIEEARAVILENYAENNDAISMELLKAWREEARNHVDYIAELAVEQHTKPDGSIDLAIYQEIQAVKQEKYELIDQQYLQAMAVLEAVKKDLADLVDLHVEMQKYYDETGEISDSIQEHASSLIERIKGRYDAIRKLMGR